jgi:nucleotide-binding universal stress UspA family protein
MSRFDDYDPPSPVVSSVFHPSDFSDGSRQAFAHALAIALLTRSRFTILNAGRDSLANRDWSEFPGVRQTLERWKLLEQGSPRSAVFERFGVKVTKVAVKSRNPASTTLAWVEENEPDLVVLATGSRRGLPHWLDASLANAIAGRSETLALFVPADGRGFVEPGSGDLTLRRVLVPVAASPAPRPGAVAAYRLAKRMGDGPTEITLLHVGDEGSLPRIDVPDDPEVGWSTRIRDGDVIEEILGAASECDADAIVMPTDGRNGFLDVLRGSHSEQVLRRLPCPLVTVPSAG